MSFQIKGKGFQKKKVLHIGDIRTDFLAKYFPSIANEEKSDIKTNKKNTSWSLPNKGLLLYCQKNWEGISGAFFQHSCVVGIKGRILIVHVEHSVHISDFQFQKKEIERKLQKFTNGDLQSILVKYDSHSV